MDERTDPVEEYRHMAPGLAPDESGACKLLNDYTYMLPALAPDESGACFCMFTVVSQEPCKLCGGYTKARLAELLANKVPQNEV